MRTSKYIMIKTKDKSTYTYHCINYFNALITMWLEIIKEKKQQNLILETKSYNYKKYRQLGDKNTVEFYIKKI